MLRLIALALIPFALVAGNAAAAKGGPSPGVSVGWDGTVDVAKAVRYVALPSAKTTTVAAVRTSDGRVLRYATIRGAFGIPYVAFDGTAEGISTDGKTLVLADLGRGPELRRASPSSAPRRSGSRRPSRFPASGPTTPCRRTAGRSTPLSTSAPERTRATTSARSASSRASRSEPRSSTGASRTSR